MPRYHSMGHRPIAYHLAIGCVILIILVLYLFGFTSIPSETEYDIGANSDVKFKERSSSVNNAPITGNEFITSQHLRTVGQVSDATRIEKTIMDRIYELFELGEKDPDSLILALNKDPLGTSVGIDNFVCPQELSQKITFPDLVNQSVIKSFKNNEEGTWIMFQHLRKAGGTSFCDTAERNMGHAAIPPYYCMPDNRGSLAIAPWCDGQFTSNHLRENGWRVAANEWDALLTDMFDWPGAVLGTTIRHPIDRWYSQYRFEHLEHRDNSDSKRMSFRKYYNSMRGWTMTSNYYVKTFIGGANDPNKPSSMGDFYWTYRKYEKNPISKNMFRDAIHNLLRLHFILVLEYIDTSSTVLKDALGWAVPPKQVLPHESQAKRDVKKSISAMEALSNEDYHFMQVDNLFDLLFFEVAKRIYLERYKCPKETS